MNAEKKASSRVDGGSGLKSGSGMVNGSRMTAFGTFVSSHPRGVIFVIVIISLVMMVFATKVEMDTGMTTFTPDSEEFIAQSKVNEKYGNTELVMVGVEAKEGSVITRDIMVKTLEFIKTVQENPRVSRTIIEPRDQAFLSVPSILADYSIALDTGQPVTGVTMDDRIGAISNRSDEDLMGLLEAFLQDPTVPEIQKGYVRLMLSEDPDRGLVIDGYIVVIVLDGSRSEAALGDAERQIDVLGKNIGPGISLHTYGEQMMMDVMHDVEKTSLLFGVAFVVIILILLLNFRTIGEMLISIMGLGLATLWAIGFLGMVGWKLDILSSVVPILIIGIGVDFSIHTLMNYREKFIEGKGDLRRITALSIGMIGAALGLATLTDAVGFSTNVSSRIPAVQHFGIMASVGIVSAFIVTITLSPAVKMLIDERRAVKGFEPVFMKRVRGRIPGPGGEPRPGSDGSGTGGSGKVPGSQGFGMIGGLFKTVSRPAVPIVIIVLFSVFSIYGATQLRSDYTFTDDLPNDSDVKASAIYLSDNFDLNTDFAIILVEGDVLDPTQYRSTIDSMANIRDDKYVVHGQDGPHVEWFGSYLKLLADSMMDPNLTAQYHALDNDSDGVFDEGVTKQEMSTLMGTVYMLDIGSHYYIHQDPETEEFDGLVIRVFADLNDYADGLQLKEELEEDFAPLEATADEVTITGNPVIFSKLERDIQRTSLTSTLYCIIAASIILELVFFYLTRSMTLGIIVSIPIFLVVVWVFGIMYIMGLPLNMMTAMTGALTIGLGIDYTIHIAYRWLWEHNLGRSLREIHENTIKHTGRNVFTSAVTTASAFGVLVFMNTDSFVQFGFVLASAIMISFIASIVILPIFLGGWTLFQKGAERQDAVPATTSCVEHPLHSGPANGTHSQSGSGGP